MNIGMIFKLLSLTTLFKDVTSEVQSAGKEGRPWYLQRTFWGATLALLSGIAAAVLGVTLDANMLSGIADNIPQLVAVGLTLWGSVLSLFGVIMKAVNAKKAA